MAIKRYVKGLGWVEIANNSSSSGKAVNIKLSDTDGFYDSNNVEGALNEIAYDIKRIKADLADHETNHPSGGDGGGGTGAILPTITSDFEITSSDGKTPIEIPIFFTSPSLGDGTVYIMVKNVEVATQQIQQGNNTIIVPAIGAGKNINISIYVKDRAGLISNQLTWVVTAGGIEIAMITDTKSDFSLNSRIALSYTISCMSEEDIYTHFIFKGYDFTNGIDVSKEESIKSINGYNSYQITDLGVGVYKVEYWAESGDYVTQHYNFSLVIVDENTVLVSTDFDVEKDYEAGIPISIPYRVSIDRDEDFTVNMYINGELRNTIVTRPSYLYWSITSLDVGNYTMKIEAFNEELGLSGEIEFNCNVIQGEYTRIQPVIDASLICWFDATERTNNDADRDTWTDKICGQKGKLYNFNYGSNGWLRPEGSTTSELTMDGTCYVEIDMTPFKDNFKNGATIELVFKTRDVGNDAARVLDITDTIAPYKGVYIDTREAYLSTASQKTYASIGEEEYIHVMYQMDRINKYAHVVINGVITKSCRLSDSGTGTSAILESIAHEQKIYLNSQKGTDNFGKCEVKHLRIYERCLSFDEILQNYLSTIEDVSLQKSKSDFNNPLKNIMPIMNITCDPEAFATMTDTNKVEVSMTYTSPNSELYGQTLTDATTCLMYWQGTSSVAYNIKNFNLELRDSNRQPIMYSPYPNCIPQSLFCLKANLMESTNAHNVGLAEYARKYLYTKQNPAQQIDSRASRTIQGFPFLLYINGELQGVYDFNLDRYSVTAFGYDLPAHKDTCRVYEISANTNFTAGAFIPWTSDQDVTEWAWYKNDFTGIYPATIQNPENDDFAALKNLISFVHDTSDRVFEIEFDTYFDKESVIRYYIMVMVFGLVDSLGKNAKLVTYDGVKWYFEFYDMDTAMGLDNTGALKYDVDIEVNSNEFNTADSALWSRVRNIFYADIVTEYNAMRNSNLTLDKIYECLFTNQIEKIPESQYNLSTQSKYLDSGEYIMMSNGNRYYNLKRWIKERLIYCDTLFKYSPTTASYITVRSGVEGAAYLDIETYYPMYITIRWRNQEDGSADQMLRIGRNEKVRFNGVVQAKDQEVIVYGAPHLKVVSGMEGMMPRHLLLNNANRLTSVECPGNTELINIQIEQCNYLQRIDLNGCSSLGSLQDSQVLKVSGCNNLRYLNAYGTILTSIDINKSGGNLVELYVPKTLQELELRNQYSLKIVGIPGSNTLDSTKIYDLRNNASNIATFTMVNCPLVERLIYDDTFTASSIFFDNYANERKGNELNTVEYEHGPWKRMMNWANGLANCNAIYIENSCYNIPGMSFRGMTMLKSLTLRAMPNLKALMLGSNCCGYRMSSYLSYDIYSEFDYDNGLSIINCPLIEEFRIHEMYPYNYSEGRAGNLTYFTFASETGVLDLPSKFPNLKLFECNLITQNIHQIILPQTLETLITCAWHTRCNEGFANEAKIEKFNIDSIFFEGEHDSSFIGIDLGNHEMTNTRIVAPYATQLLGVNIKNTYVNPVFNELKVYGNTERPPIVPNGTVDVSEFKWRKVSDWFAFMDFTNTKCNLIQPEDWDTFLGGITEAEKMFYHCINPAFSWEFAMKFFSKVQNNSKLSQMYQYAQLKEQADYDTEGVVIENDNNIGGYSNGQYPFVGSNLKYVKSLRFGYSEGAYGTFYNCTTLEKVGDCTFEGLKSGNTSNLGMGYLFYNCSSLQEVGNITSAFNSGGTRTMPLDSMFAGCSALKSVGTLDIAANSMESMYEKCSLITTDGVSFPDTTNVTSMSSIFKNCKSLTEITIDNIDKVVDADYILSGCSALTKVSLPGIGPESLIQNFQYAFSSCAKLTEIEIGGSTLPKELRNMSHTFDGCAKLPTLPPLPDFTYDADLSFCCAHCDALTDSSMYTEIPYRVININSMYYDCLGLVEPVVNINTDNVEAKQMFRVCPNITKLTVNFNGRLLKNSVKFAEGCSKLETVNFKFPSALLMNEYYGTGVTYYLMFQNCPNLKIVNLDMSSLVETNTKADFGGMFYGTSYLEEINGLDMTCLKKPIRSWSSSQGGGTHDNHDTSITYGGSYDNLNTFGLLNALGTSYDFRSITSLAHTKTILNHLDTVTNETLGVTYNIQDAIDDEKTENVDQELKTLAQSAANKGWSFIVV